MKIDDPKILAFKAKVAAMTKEFDMATTFHELWTPAVYDSDLHARLGTSYAT